MRNGRRGGCLRTFVIAIVVLIVILLALDFGARAFAEQKLASEIQQHGFPKKPSVSIAGFPFLTQVISRNLDKVTLNSSNINENPLRISKVSAVMTGIHLNSGYTSGTVRQLTGSVLVTFPALAQTLDSQIGPLGSLVGASGLTLSQAGPHEVKANLSLIITSGSAVWRISRVSGQKLRVRLVSSSNIPSSLLGQLRDFTIKIPQLPLGVQIDTVAVTPDGLTGQISGHNLTFGG
jgi:LmeA-like phospholipid-binding